MRCSPFSFSLKQAACMHWLRVKISSQQHRQKFVGQPVRNTPLFLHCRPVDVFIFFTYSNLQKCNFFRLPIIYLFFYLFNFANYIHIHIHTRITYTMDKWQRTRYSLRQLQRPFNGYTFKNIKNSTEHYTTNYETCYIIHI